MATPVIMPKFGMAQEEGTIIRWLKGEGDSVEKGETLLEVQTDKIDMEVESPATGELVAIQYGPDATVPVATVIAHVAAPGEQITLAGPATVRPAQAPAAGAAPPARTEAKASPVAQRLAADQGIDLSQVAGSGPAGRITKADVQQALVQPAVAVATRDTRARATPAARRLARETALQLAAVEGTGPHGRIQAADVEQHLRAIAIPGALAPAPTAVAAAAGEPLRGMRKTIAARLSHSWQSIPHIFLSTSMDMTAANAVQARLEADVAAAGGRLTLTVLIAKAVALALARHPRLNAWLRPKGEQWLLAEQEQIDLGIAVALDDGLIVPVVRAVDKLGLAALAAQIGELSQKARANQLSPAEVAGGTFTISNLGMYPIDHFTAIINPPQVAILAVGRAEIRPVWDGHVFEPKPVMEVTLSVDHRAVDGAVGAAFLAEVKRLVEEPARMLL